MSATEAYAVAANLLLKSNVQESLPGIIRDFDKLASIVRAVNESMDRMAASFETGARKMARAQQTAAEASVRAATTTADKVVRVQESAADRVTRIQEAAARRATEIQARQMAAYERSEAEHENRMRDRLARQAEAVQQAAARQYARDTHVSAMDVSMAAGGAANAGRGFLTAAGHAALEPAQTMSMLRADSRVTDAQANQASDAAWAATQTGQGTTYGGNLEAIVDLKNVTGSLADAVKILPQFAQLSAVLAAVDKKGGGAGDQAFAAAKAMEILGLLTEEVRNPETGKLEPQINAGQLPEHMMAFARIAVATQGRVDPKSMLGFAKTARVGGMQLSKEFLEEKLPAIILALGADRSGTAMQSMSQIFQGGRLTKKSRQEMADLGLAGDAHEETTGSGASKRTRIVGKIFEQDLLASDPAAWASKVHDHLVNDLKMSETDAINSVQKMAQRSTVAGLLADLMKDAAGILKEQANVHNTLRSPNGDAAALSGFLASNPQANLNRLHDSFENLMAALGGPAMGPAIRLMDALTGSLNAFGDWAKRNPIAAEAVTGVVAAGTAIAGAVAAISMAMMVYGPVIAAGRAMMAGVPAAAAAAGAEGAALSAGAAGAAGVGARTLIGRAAIPLAAGLAVHELDGNDAIGSWVDGHVPGAAWMDDFAYRHTGGLVGRERQAAPRPGDLGSRQTGPMPVTVTNPGDLARANISNLARQANRPDAGIGGFDATGSTQSHVNTGLQ